MTTITPNTTASGAADTIFQAMADRAYCNYIEQLRRDECLGWEHKVKTGKFGEVELKAHKKAAEYLGAHRAFSEAAKLIAASAPVAPAPQLVPSSLRTQWLTVVYRGVEAGDEARVICDHPKVSAVSWSHALDDRDAALAAAPKAAPAPVSKSFDEWLEKQFEFRNYYFDLRGPGLMAIPFARRAYEAGRAPVAEDAIALLSEVAHYFTGNDDLPNDLLPRIDALLDAQAAQPEGAKP